MTEAPVPVPALRVRALHHAFGRETVLEGIDFELRAGEIVALVGPSGCGKTTLLHLCAKLLHPDGGTIDDGFATRACMFQQPRLLPWKSALDNVAIVLAARGIARGECEHRAREIGLRLGLAHGDFAKFPHQLSGGMQSRIALARALVIEPDLLLLDEPFSALDIGLREEMYRLLLDHLAARRVGVLMITHDLGEAVRLSDRILVMAARPGRIVSRFELDTPAARRDDSWIHANTARLLARPEVRESFGLPPAVAAAGDRRTVESAAADPLGMRSSAPLGASSAASLGAASAASLGAAPVAAPVASSAAFPVAPSVAPSATPSVIPFERRAPRC